MENMAATMSEMTEADCNKLDQILAVEEDRITSLQAVKDRISSSQADLLEARTDKMAEKFADLKRLQEKRKKELSDKNSVDSYLGWSLLSVNFLADTHFSQCRWTVVKMKYQ